MALANKKTQRIHNKSGSDLDKMQAKFDDGTHLELIANCPDDFPELCGMLLQMQNLSDDVDSLRSYANEVKEETNIPTTTANHTVSFSVTNTNGSYALVFTMVDNSGASAVTKTATINLE
jgi:hypothetical protein